MVLSGSRLSSYRGQPRRMALVQGLCLIIRLDQKAGGGTKQNRSGEYPIQQCMGITFNLVLKRLNLNLFAIRAYVFIGLFIGILFLLASGSIMYYKQIIGLRSESI